MPTVPASEGEWKQFYPEVVTAGTLSGAVNVALREVCSTLAASAPEPPQPFSVTYARIKRGSRFSQIYVAAKERLFLMDFWRRGVCMANGKSPDLSQVASALDFWISRSETTLSELEQKFPWTQRDKTATAFEEGREVDQQWELIGQRASSLHPDLPKLVARAAQEPRLRQLFPFTSLASLNFSRCTGYPFDTEGLPFIWPAGAAQFRVHLRPDTKLGCGDADFAIRLAVQNLPAFLGPAGPGTAEDGKDEA